MPEFQIIGLKAPAGFSINEHLKNNPANKRFVYRKEREVLNYIKSFYSKGINPIYSQWYAGMTDGTHNRYNAHKRERRIDDLTNYKKFYLYTMSNARELESRLFQKHGMGKSNIKGGIYIHSKYVYVFFDPIAK
ncbi:MAG: hypothetical protein R2821_08225 [Flavobacteriaceae bacterium]